MLGSRIAWLAPLALTACSFAPIDLDGRDCPCVSGYHCEVTHCVRDTDASPDTGTDAATDAVMDGSGDVAMDASMDGSGDAPADATSDATPDGAMACTPTDGNYGAPTLTLSLGTNMPGSIYYGDIQAAFPTTDWANLDRIYVEAGTYDTIYLGNLPRRALTHPLVITNHNGQVVAHLFSADSGSGWVLTGRYDPVSGTGSATFPGHRGGVYANTQGHYGFLFRKDANGDPQVSVGGTATSFEVEYVEIVGGPYTSMQVRTDATDIENFRLHDNYIHDGFGHGIWLNPSAGGTGNFRNARVDHNRIARVVNAGYVVNSTREGCRIDHNAVINSADDWRNSNAAAWMVSLAPEGDLESDHNTFAGAPTGFFEIFPAAAGTTGLTARFHDEWYADSLAQVGTIRPRDAGELGLRFESNRFGKIRFGFDVIDSSARPPDPLMAIVVTANPVALVNNRYEAMPARSLVSPAANVTETGDTTATLGGIPFVDAYPGDDALYDFPNVSVWSATQTRSTMTPMRTYSMGEHVIRNGHIYVCTVAASTNEPPESTPASWQDLGLPPDDLRVSPSACDIGAP